MLKCLGLGTYGLGLGLEGPDLGIETCIGITLKLMQYNKLILGIIIN